MPRMSKKFGERQRRALIVKPMLDRLESRSTVTPVGAAALGIGQVGGMRATGGGVMP